jgi:Uma2 family endonuclease
MATRERAGAAHRDAPEQMDARAAVMVPPLPPLENGDRLTRAEFERRYEAMPHLKRAELIDGVVYVPSPVRYEHHGRRSSDLETWLGVYSAATPGTMSAGNTTLRLDLDTEVQPDVLLRLEQGGRSRIDAEDYVEGAPELVVEVAASSASYDLHDKLRVYRRSGVQEYVVWRVLDQAVDWLALHEGTYRPLEADAAGIVRSAAFPGLWLAVPALLAGDRAAVLATLQVGLASPEHAAFAARLRATSSLQSPATQT